MAHRRKYHSHKSKTRSTHKSSTTPVDHDSQDWVPTVDKNPHYRLHQLLCSLFRKFLRLEEAKGDQCNSTDGKSVWVKFNEYIMEPITEEIRSEPERHVYRLRCGHPKVVKGEKNVGDFLPCFICGAHQSLLAMLHEWSHNIAHDFHPIITVFVDEMTKDYHKLAPQLDRDSLRSFLFMVTNAFGDYRVNSLLYLWYRGAAMGIIERWKRLATKLDDRINQDFICFCLGIGIGLEPDPQGKFGNLIPVVRWGMDRIQRKGPANGMAIIRVVMDRCISTIINDLSPPTPQPQAGDPPDQKPPAPDYVPALQQTKHTYKDVGGAFEKLMKGAKPLDEKEEHKVATPEEIKQHPKARMFQPVLDYTKQMNQTSLDQFDKSLDIEIDDDMAGALQQAQQGLVSQSLDSQLTSDAKAQVLLIDVGPHHIEKDSYVILGNQEKELIQSLRSAFHRVLGRMRTAVAPEGDEIDIQEAIQYRIEVGFEDADESLGASNTTDIFRKVQPHQGFGYMILSDMSGSMLHTFPEIAHATDMLSQALRFPFVEGRLWGFRGGEGLEGRDEKKGEVWIYRYHKNCRGYVGESQIRHEKELVKVPVCCGGLTPMNAAIRVGVRHLLTQLPHGMVKRLFLLTDGSPWWKKISGRMLPDWLLRQFVTKEVNWARSQGVQVFTLIIGEGITDEHALKMFGHQKYWKRSQGARRAGTGSTKLQAGDPEGVFRDTYFPSDAENYTLHILSGQNAGYYGVRKRLDDDKLIVGQALFEEDEVQYVLLDKGEDVGHTLFRLVKDNFTKYLSLHQ